MSPAPALLTRGKVVGQNVAGGGGVYDLVGPDVATNGQQRINCAGDSSLTIEADMTGAATTDLTVAVQPYEADGVTVMPIQLPSFAGQEVVAPTLSGGHVYATGTYDVRGYDNVRVRITNANVGAQTLNASWRLS